MIGLAGGAAVIGAALAAMVFWQFLKRREYHLFVWGVGLTMFAFVSAFEVTSFYQAAWVPDVGLHRAYLAMYPILVGLLGLGAVYRLADKRWGYGFLSYVLVLTGVLLFFTATAPVDTTTLWPAWVLGFTAIPDNIGFLSLLLLSSGAVALVGGALYSWHKTHEEHNLLIVAGAGLMIMAAILPRYVTPYYVGELYYTFLIVGIVVMSAGFLHSRVVAQGGRAQPATASVE
ncbi:MAG: hypothetical protein ACE5EW_00555 [Thermoplasmata archaeon]